MKITIKQAAEAVGVSDQCMRVMIQNGVIEGAKCYGPKVRRTYFITDEIIKDFMKGGRNEGQ
jgi:excisionase family DNA binding protein